MPRDEPRGKDESYLAFMHNGAGLRKCQAPVPQWFEIGRVLCQESGVGSHGQLKDLCSQVRKILLDSCPYNGEVNVEVSMCKDIAHLICKTPRYLRIRVRKIRVVSGNIPGSLTDILKVPDNSILSFRIKPKVFKGHVRCVLSDAVNRDENVSQTVINAKLFAHHIGLASARI